MIDARELRIGNWTQFNNEFTWLDGYSLYLASRGDIELDPIPLTPEILEKCGEIYIQPFEWQFRVKVSAISILFRRNSDIWYSELGGIYLRDKIQHLHQLQNLFWCLVGKELEIKL